MRVPGLLTILVLVLSPPAPVAAREARDVVDETIKKVIKLLDKRNVKNPESLKETREKVLEALLAVVDMDRVAFLTLANYRKKFSEKEIEEFKTVFSKLLFSTYISHMENYSHEEIAIVESSKIGDTRTVVKTKVLTGDKEIPIDYSMVKDGKGWKLYDVKVEGVSMVRNYRSQFREILVGKSPEYLLKKLQKKVEQNEKKL